MIPQIIHYCWFGGKEIPANLRTYMDTWYEKMPGWEVRAWTEENFSIADAPLYVRQAYETRKFAFVSDYVRLWALEQCGGVYFDTDVEVIRSFDLLPEFKEEFTNSPILERVSAFIGFEESKAKTLGTNVIGCEPHCAWVREMLDYYDKTPFIREDGSMDMTANSKLIARLMEEYGLVRNGKEQIITITNHQSPITNQVETLHVYDYHVFSPITSTRVMRKNKNTFSIHHCYGSWTSGSRGNRFRNSAIVREIVNALIQIKRLFE